MGDPGKKTYREINGSTRVGDFLRKIGRSDILADVISLAKNSGLPFLDVVGDVLLRNKDIAEADQRMAFSLLERDIKESAEISARWSNDMLSDSWLSKNIRPLVLVYSWILISIMIFFKNEINDAYIVLVQGLAISVNVAYFGGREWSKVIKLKNK